MDTCRQTKVINGKNTMFEIKNGRWTARNRELIKRGHLPKMVYMMGRTAFGHSTKVNTRLDSEYVEYTDEYTGFEYVRSKPAKCEECGSHLYYNNNSEVQCEKCGLIIGEIDIYNMQVIKKKYKNEEIDDVDDYGLTLDDWKNIRKLRKKSR
jgi:hypothetical protein